MKCSEQLFGDYKNQVEQKLRQYPEQWFNYYDFWSWKIRSKYN